MTIEEKLGFLEIDERQILEGNDSGWGLIKDEGYSDSNIARSRFREKLEAAGFEPEAEYRPTDFTEKYDSEDFHLIVTPGAIRFYEKESEEELEYTVPLPGNTQNKSRKPTRQTTLPGLAGSSTSSDYIDVNLDIDGNLGPRRLVGPR